MTKSLIDFYTRLAHAIATQFGSKCEVAVYDLQDKEPAHSIIAIENGHVTGRNTGDGLPADVLASFQRMDAMSDKLLLEDKLAYLTKTKDGKVLKNTLTYIRSDSGTIIGALGIHFDITTYFDMATELNEMIGLASITNSTAPGTSSPSSIHVGELLDELIEQSFRAVGKPVELMNKDDKIRFVKALNDAGAFLITKSGPKVCQYLDISKYTLYSYLDEIKSRAE